MNENQFFANTRSKPTVPAVFADDTRHPGVIHARVLNLLEHGLVTEALELVEKRGDVVQDSTCRLLLTHAASRHLFQ